MIKLKIFSAIALMAALQANSQANEGKVVYERKINMHKRLPPEAEQMKNMIPEFQTSKVELSFNATQSLFRNLPEEQDQMPEAGGGDGGRRMMFRMGGGNPNDETFRDYDKEMIVETRELGPKKYLIDDTLHPLKWKMEQDTMTINGYLCYKATTVTSAFGMGMGGGQRPGGDSARQNQGGNNQNRRFNIPAEQKVEAWFTQDIATSAGPDNYFGLPGLIMKVIVDDGTIVYSVLSIDTNAKVTVKAPTSGKKITREEYRKMMQQQFQGMRPPGGGGPGGGQRMMIIQQ